MLVICKPLHFGVLPYTEMCHSEYENMSNSELEHKRVDVLFGTIGWSPWVISALSDPRVITPSDLYFPRLPEYSAQDMGFQDACQS